MGDKNEHRTWEYEPEENNMLANIVEYIDGRMIRFVCEFAEPPSAEDAALMIAAKNAATPPADAALDELALYLDRMADRVRTDVMDCARLRQAAAALRARSAPTHNLTEQDTADIARVLCWLKHGDTPPAAEIERIVHRNAELRGIVDALRASAVEESRLRVELEMMRKGFDCLVRERDELRARAVPEGLRDAFARLLVAADNIQYEPGTVGGIGELNDAADEVSRALLAASKAAEG